MLARGYSGSRGSRGSLDGWSTDNRLRADFNTGDLAHTLILGAEYHRFRNDLWTGAGGAAPLTRLAAIPRRPDIPLPTATTIIAAITRPGCICRMRWSGTAGMWMFPPATTASFPSRSAIPGTSNRRSDDHISGRASLLYAPRQRSVALPELQPAITPAMLPGADGKPLKPTTAEQVEAGLKFQPPGSSDLYSIAIYDLTQKDVATRDPNIATATYIPAGKVHSQGVELEAHHQITPQLSTIASYTGIVCVSGH